MVSIQSVALSCFYKSSDSIIIQRVVIFTVYTEVMVQDKQGCYSLYFLPDCVFFYWRICNNYDTMAFYRSTYSVFTFGFPNTQTQTA